MTRLAFALCLALFGTARAADGGWVYPDPEGRYQIVVPADWTATRIDERRLMLRWPAAAKTQESCNVIVAEDSFTSSYSQDELDSAIRGGLFEALLLKQVRWSHPEAKLKQERVVEFQGHPAQSGEVTLTAHIANKDTAGEEYIFYFTMPGQVFKEYCDAYASHFARMQPAFDKTMRSLKITRR